MAAVAPAANPAELIQNLSLESKKSSNDPPQDVKKPSGNQFKLTKGGEKPKTGYLQSGRSVTPMPPEYMDPNLYYFPNGYPTTAYYCGGYDCEEYPRYLSPDAMEMAPPGWDIYHHGYGYPPYFPFTSPGSTVPSNGHDGQLYGSQHCQLPNSYFQPSMPANASKFDKQGPTSKEVSTSAPADLPSVPLESTKANSNTISDVHTNGNSTEKTKPGQKSPSFTPNGSKIDKGVPLRGFCSSGCQDPRYGSDTMWSPVAWFGSPHFADVQHRPAATNSISSKATHASDKQTAKNLNPLPLPQYFGMHAAQPGFGPVTPGIMNRMYPASSACQTNSSFRDGFGFRFNDYDSRMSGQWWVVSDNKYKARGRSNGYYSYVNDKLDGLDELNRGPRAEHLRNQKDSEQIVTPAKEEVLPTVGNDDDVRKIPDSEQYNKTDFPESYSDAKFFVIKSYSEDDVHKSIKYNVWASTPNGNRKLDSAYQEGQLKTAGCPIFLFFSVNTSGQFIGVAEMVGPVDFNKMVEHWQQDKWTGCFPVKWHIIKDVPNGILKHITLENNDNKPVTNSRDTQEVKLEQGIQMIKIFKEHVSKTCILDDFNFYDNRQKIMQENRTRLQQTAKKAMDCKSSDVEEGQKISEHGMLRSQARLEPVAVLKNKAPDNGLGANVTAATLVLLPEDPSPVTEKNAETNVIVDGV